MRFVTQSLVAFGFAMGALGAGPAMAGDAQKGARVFKKCQACHQVGPEAKTKTGPILNGIVGRDAATYEGFKYSKALMEAGAEGLVWTPEELDAFLKKPRSYLKGTKMSFAGLRKDSQREDVIAYLATFGPDGAEQSGEAAESAATSAKMAAAEAMEEGGEAKRAIEVKAKAADVWAMIGDFCDIDDWHPAAASCALEAADGKVLRRLALEGGGEILERLDDVGEMSYSYTILESPLPVEGYSATLSVKEDDDGGARITWESSFTPKADNAAEVIGGIYDAGLNAVAARFE